MPRAVKQAVKKATPAKVAPAKAVPASAGANATTFDWSKLAEVEVATYTTNKVLSTIDVEADTPAPIKERLYASYKAYISVSGNSTDTKVLSKAARGAWRVQRFANADQAAEFVRLAKRFCKNRRVNGEHAPLTFRGGQQDAANANVVRFLVKPYEARV